MQQKEAQIIQGQCEKDEAACKEERESAAAIKKDCEGRLEEAMPAYEAVQKALRDLNKSQIDEVKSMKAPPSGVVFTMEAVGKLMAVEPVMIPKKSGFGRSLTIGKTQRKHTEQA